MGPVYSIGDFLDLLRRRVWVIIAVTLLGCLVSLWIAANQQHLYESAEVIQVSRPTIADDLAKSTVDGSSARRMQLIEQRVMARSSILEIVEKYDLFSDLPDLKPSQKVARLREAVRLTGVAAAREGFTDDGTISVLTITAQMPTPLQAQQVASEFGRRTIELSVSTRIEQARETLSFFAEKEAALVRNIAELESEITVFHSANDVAQPGTVEFRRAEIATINEGLLEIAREEIEIRRAADQAQASERPATARRMLVEFEDQLTTLDAQRNLLATRKTELEASLETTPEVQRQIAAYDRRMEQIQNELETIRARRNEAEVGFRLETSRQAERLTILEPASLPDYPITGARKKKALIGGMGSLLVAFVVAYLLDLMKPVLRTAAHMERETGLVPVAVIPELKVPKKRKSILDVFTRAKPGKRRRLI